MKIYKAEHDKIKKETKPTKRNWQFNRMAQHYVLKKQKTKKKWAEKNSL